MKLAISYFYQIRNFKRNMIPVSTAIRDPAWYHANLGEKYIFKDKRGIINGIRLLPFHPNEECEILCGGADKCSESGPSACKFLKTYKQQLEKLNLDNILKELEILSNNIKSQEKFDEEPIIVFIVYETPDNPCSERQVLLQYFKEKNVDCKELEYPIQTEFNLVKNDTFDF